MDLKSLNLIYETPDDHFFLSRAEVIPHGFQSFAINRASGTILMDLAKEGGKTAEQLAKVVPDEAKVSPQDYWSAINLLMGDQHVVTRDEDGKLWSVANPKPRVKN